MERFDELLSEYLDGSLDAAGRDELASLIDADPARRETFVSMVREHRLLAAELRDSVADGFARRVMADVDKGRTQFVRAVMADVKGPGSGGKRPSPPPRRPAPPPGGQTPGWVLWASLAAGLLVVVAILLSVMGGEEPSKSKLAREKPKPEKTEPAPPQPRDAAQEILPTPSPRPPLPAPPRREPKDPEPPAPPVPKVTREPEPAPAPKPPVPAPPAPPEKPPVTVTEVATLESVEGDVILGDAAAAPGPLTAGFVLETKTEKSTAVFRYPDGTKVEVGGLSRLQDEPTRPGHVLTLAGIVTAEVAKQPAEKPMIFLTVHAEARVVGTRLRIEAAGDSTRLDVTEGKVRLTRLKDRAAVDVTAGHYAVASPTGSLTSKLARTSTGLVAFYAFKEGKGGVVHDSSHSGAPLDLRIEGDAAVKWTPKGLVITAPVLISSGIPATKISQACKGSNEVTVEAWVRPGTLTPTGKDGRIVALSSDTMNQDFLLGQEELKGPLRSYFMRLRTTATDQVGKPALETPEGTAVLKLSHLVYTRTAAGVATFFIDGVDVARSTGGGVLAPWNDGYRLSVGNELSGDRPWLGELHLIAVYSRALAADDVKQNFKAGAE